MYTNSLLFIDSGGTSRLAGVMLAGATAGIMLVGPVIVGFIPVMVVGALIFLLGIELMEEALVDTWGKLHRHEYLTVSFQFLPFLANSPGCHYCSDHGCLGFRLWYPGWHYSGLLELRRPDVTKVRNPRNVLWQNCWLYSSPATDPRPISERGWTTDPDSQAWRIFVLWDDC